MAETPVKQVQAQIYVATGGNWTPKTAGIANIVLYHNAGARSYRIIGMDGGNAVVNSTLFEGLQYQESSATFHMWTDKQGTYGLNFADAGSASQFSAEVKRAVQALSAPPPTMGGGGGGGGPPPPPPPPAEDDSPPPPSSSGGALTLAEQIALKKQKGLKKTETVEKGNELPGSSGGGGDAPPPKSSGGGGGGNLMGDLLGALNRRKQGGGSGGGSGGSSAPVQPKEPVSAPVKAPFKANKAPAKNAPAKNNSSPSLGGGGSLSSQELQELKESILQGVREELEKFKEEILAAINNK